MGELEDLKKLPPEQRLKKLKELEERRKKEEQEARRLAQESEVEIKEEEEKKIKEILEEAELELKLEKQKKDEQDEDTEDRDLEEKISQEKAAQQEGGPQYKHSLDEINQLANQQETINYLTYKEEWSEQDQESYNAAKENIAAATYMAEKYSNDVGDEVLNDLIASREALEAMGYKRRKWTED